MFFFCSIGVKPIFQAEAFASNADGRLGSGNDVGSNLVFDEGDAVA
jgi:hypothetical protein